MCRLACLALASLILLAFSSTHALARLMQVPASIPERVAQAETIIIGKVTLIENEKISLPVTPASKQKANYFVAVVHIEEAIRGAKDLTDLKVGYTEQDQAIAIDENSPKGGFLKLKEDLEVCLFLKPHHSGEFEILSNPYSAIAKRSDGFAREVELTKKCLKLLADPDRGLKSDSIADRFLTASMLLVQYRRQETMSKGEINQEPIPAAQSRLILKAFAETDWGKPDPALGYHLRPEILFARLGLTKEDGWEGPVTPDAAKKWLKEHGDKYRVKHYVAERTGKKKD